MAWPAQEISGFIKSLVVVCRHEKPACQSFGSSSVPAIANYLIVWGLNWWKHGGLILAHALALSHPVLASTSTAEAGKGRKCLPTRRTRKQYHYQNLRKVRCMLLPFHGMSNYKNAIPSRITERLVPIFEKACSARPQLAIFKMPKQVYQNPSKLKKNFSMPFLTTSFFSLDGFRRLLVYASRWSSKEQEILLDAHIQKSII